MLAWRDFAVRYKQTLLGLAWSVVRPLATTFVFTLIFGSLANLPSGEIPYPLLVLSGLLAWQLFQQIVQTVATSILDSRAMIEKVYFPRILLPLARVFTALIDMGVGLVVLLAFCFYWHVVPGTPLFALPCFVLLTLVLAFSTGLIVATFSVRYRDVQHLLPFTLQLLMFLSPVAFSSAIIPDRYQTLYAINPLVPIINGIRWSLLGAGGALNAYSILYATVFSLSMLVLGLYTFRRFEADIVDTL